MRIALIVESEKLPNPKWVKLIKNDEVGLIDKFEDCTLIEGEQKAFTVRKDIIKKLGPKTKVDFKICSVN